ncbi:beta-1,6-N-acetylglucosaminyltransferase [Empedobacter falsenii]|uniref:beta-1,6-N-acetylglucosaminyltransferase n=1 Tax=Empedobacter falsenii TaxID=343874 RepID=UPI003A7FFA39
MKNAYLIQCHKDPQLVNRIIKQISDKSTDIYIHVDIRSDIVKDLIKASNVFIVHNRFAVDWGSFNQVLATLEMLKMTVNKNYNYLSLISGQDFPIKTNELFYDYLENSQKSEFIEVIQLPIKEWSYEGGLGRVKYHWLNYLTPKRNLTARILRNIYLYTFGKLFAKDITKLGKIYGGSSWFTLTGELVNYMVSFLKNNPDYIDVYKNSGCADEIFFQTLIMNSPFKDKVVNDNLRFIKWENGKSSPNILTIFDEDEILKSSKFFMRKVDSNLSKDLVIKFSKS